VRVLWQGKRVAVSGSGNVAQYAVEKLLELGAIPITMSDSTGYIYEPEGITKQQLETVFDIKNVKRGFLTDFKSSNGGELRRVGPWTGNRYQIE
jgi:glutamate dehydrogenase (NADP+)